LALREREFVLAARAFGVRDLAMIRHHIVPNLLGPLVILMTLIGGLGTLTGPILGAFIVVLLENKVGDFGQALAKLTGVDWFLRLGESVTIVIGLIFVICVLAFRRGIVGELAAFAERRRAARA
ncbi:hypothetical protein KUA57_09510, partial [Streptococcus sp. DM3B3]|nr:hypothetical protein [Streptococcus vulneris]